MAPLNPGTYALQRRSSCLAPADVSCGVARGVRPQRPLRIGLYLSAGQSPRHFAWQHLLPSVCVLSPARSSSPHGSSFTVPAHARRKMTGLIWEARSGGDVEGRTVVGGKVDKDDDKRVAYVARVVTEDGVARLGYIAPPDAAAVFAEPDCEGSSEEYELLFNPEDVTLEYVPASGGEIPTGAVLGGKSENDNKVYIARAVIEDNHVPGSIEHGAEAALVPLGGEVHSAEEYQVLCVKLVRPENA